MRKCNGMIKRDILNTQISDFLRHKSQRVKRIGEYETTFRRFEEYLIARLEQNGLACGDAERVLEQLDFRKFYWCDDLGVYEPIDARFLEDWLFHRLEAGESLWQYNRRKGHLKQFFDWIAIRPNPAEGVLSARPGYRTEIEPLSLDEFRRLVVAAKRSSLRDHALVLVMGMCALRPGEVMSLRLSDYHPTGHGMSITIPRERRKRGIAHTVPVPNVARKILDEYVSRRYRLISRVESYEMKLKSRGRRVDGLDMRIGHVASRHLFPGRSGRMSRSELVYILHSVCDNAGVRRINPHVMRHSAASILVSLGYSVEHVSRILGHRQLTTTLGYVHVSPELLRREFENSPFLKEISTFLLSKDADSSVKIDAFGQTV